METKRKMRNEHIMAATNILHGPGYHPIGAADDEAPKSGRIREWIKRRMLDLGVLEMTNSQPKPSGFNVNLTTISLLVGIVLATLTICATVAGGFYWAWTTAKQQGIEIGIQQTEKKQLEERLKALEQEKAAEEFVEKQEEPPKRSKK